jgi:hypothetical protein
VAEFRELKLFDRFMVVIIVNIKKARAFQNNIVLITTKTLSPPPPLDPSPNSLPYYRSRFGSLTGWGDGIFPDLVPFLVIRRVFELGRW